MSWKCQFGLANSLHGFKQIFDDCRDGNVTLGGPNPHTSVEIVRDGNGDIAHGFSIGASRPSFSICKFAPMDGNYLHHLPPTVGLAAFGPENGRYWYPTLR